MNCWSWFEKKRLEPLQWQTKKITKKSKQNPREIQKSKKITEKSKRFHREIQKWIVGGGWGRKDWSRSDKDLEQQQSNIKSSTFLRNENTNIQIQIKRNGFLVQTLPLQMGTLQLCLKITSAQNCLTTRGIQSSFAAVACCHICNFDLSQDKFHQYVHFSTKMYSIRQIVSKRTGWCWLQIRGLLQLINMSESSAVGRNQAS